MILDHEEFDVLYKFLQLLYLIALDDSDYYKKELSKGLVDLALEKHENIVYMNGEWK